MTDTNTTNPTYPEDYMQLLTELDTLSENIGYSLIRDKEHGLAGEYGKQLIWTIGPAIRMLVWGLENNQSLSTMNGLRTLLENWANANYVFRAGKKGQDHYLKGMDEAAKHYRNAFQELRDNPTLGIQHLKGAPRWSGKGLDDRVGELGEGPLFQYEYLSRYVHADVWATLNEFDIKDPNSMNKVLLTWGIDFVNHTLWLICEEELIDGDLLDTAKGLNERVATLLSKGEL